MEQLPSDAEASRWQRLRQGLRRHWPLVVITALAVPMQIWLGIVARPGIFFDSYGYFALAEGINRGDWSGFYFRTPGYPTIVALVNLLFGVGDHQALIRVQLALASLMPAMIYTLFLKLTGRRAAAAAAAGTYLFDQVSLNVPTVVLTEFFAQFFLLLVLLAFLSVVQTKSILRALLTGVLLAALVMIRPSFQLLHYCLVAGALIFECVNPVLRKTLKKSVLCYGVMLLTAQVPLWAWSAKIYKDYGSFALSTMAGASLLNHTGDIMEQAPPSLVRDIYLEEKRKNGGDHINRFEEAQYRLEHQHHVTAWESARRFSDINRVLIRNNPGWYVRRVVTSFGKLWLAPNFYVVREDSQNPVRPYFEQQTRIPVLGWIYLGLKAFLSFPYLGEILATLLFFTMLYVWSMKHGLFTQAGIQVVAVGGAVVYHMFIHAMVQATEFGRYRIPVQPIIYGAAAAGVAVWCVDWWARRQQRRAPDQQGA